MRPAPMSLAAAPAITQGRLASRLPLRLAWGVGALAAIFEVAAAFLAWRARGVASVDTWVAILIAAPYPVFGVLVVRRQPRNPIGWLLLVTALAAAVMNASKAYALNALHVAPALPGGVAGVWLSAWMWWIVAGAAPLIYLLFPNGSLLSRRWRPVVWFAAASALALLLCAIVAPADFAFYGFPAIRNPLALPGAAGTALQGLFIALVGVNLVLPFAGVASLALRFRRAQMEERQQIKWVLSAIVFDIILATADAFVSPSLGMHIDAPGALCVSAAITVAILRYRLWDIDVIINRTLVYGALTACVAAIYVLVVGYLGVLFRSGDNLPISLVATGVVAALFQPLRERLQRGVNRLLYGQRDEPYAVLSRLGRRLEGALAPEAALSAIAETVARSLKLPYAAVAIPTAPEQVSEQEYEIVSSYGVATAAPVVLPLVYQTETVGWLLLAPRAPDEAFTPADMRLLNDLARQAGVAVHAARLTTDLQRSRQRLVTAREEERLRLRRDLHDGLGPTLALLTLSIDSARQTMRRDLDAAEQALIDLKAQMQGAVKDIRQLVYDLRPPALDDLGLVAALRELAAHHQPDGLRVTVEAPDPLPPLAAAVEVATYRIAQEALTNVVRHASAHACAISLAVDGALTLRICDDGEGLPAEPRAGVGLRSMRERAEELGGTLEVAAAPSGGVCVTARIPLGASPVPLSHRAAEALTGDAIESRES